MSVDTSVEDITISITNTTGNSSLFGIQDTMLGTLNTQISNAPLTSGQYTVTTTNTAGINYQYYQPTITTTSNPSSLEVKGDAIFDGNITWKGKNLGELLSTIEDRLAILQPDPKKLEKYAALKKAYDHYKTLEKLIGED